MRDQLLLALILSLGATGCNSFQGLVGKKSSGDSAAVTAPGESSGDAAKGVDKKEQQSCPATTKGEDESEYGEDKEAGKKTAKDNEKSDDEDTALTHDGMEHESDDDCEIKEGEDD